MDIITLKNFEILNKIIIKKKERHNMILEPLQMMFQIALISYCPKGTKLSINDNIVIINEIGITQGIIRWISNDNKQDLLHLYNAFIRFNKFYKTLENKNNKFFKLLKERVDIGLNNLIETYKDSDNINIVQSLVMFKDINSHKITDLTDTDKDVNIDTVFSKIHNLYSDYWINILYNTLVLLDKDPSNFNSYITGINYMLTPKNNDIKKWIRSNIII